VEQGWFRQDGTIAPHVPFVETEVRTINEEAAEPTFGPPTEEESLQKAYEVKSDAAIKTLKKATLVALCVNKLKGKCQDYEMNTKSVLAELILRLVSLSHHQVCNWLLDDDVFIAIEGEREN